MDQRSQDINKQKEFGMVQSKAQELMNQRRLSNQNIQRDKLNKLKDDNEMKGLHSTSMIHQQKSILSRSHSQNNNLNNLNNNNLINNNNNLINNSIINEEIINNEYEQHEEILYRSKRKQFELSSLTYNDLIRKQFTFNRVRYEITAERNDEEYGKTIIKKQRSHDKKILWKI